VTELGATCQILGKWRCRLARHVVEFRFTGTSHENSKEWCWSGWSWKVGITKIDVHEILDKTENTNCDS